MVITTGVFQFLTKIIPRNYFPSVLCVLHVKYSYECPSKHELYYQFFQYLTDSSLFVDFSHVQTVDKKNMVMNKLILQASFVLFFLLGLLVIYIILKNNNKKQ